MSSTRVKRTYDTFCGDEAMSTTPQCSPMRITSLGQQQQNVSELKMPPQAVQHGHQHVPYQQRLNFDECKEEGSSSCASDDGSSSSNMQMEEGNASSSASSATATVFSSFNYNPTFTSLHSSSSHPSPPSFQSSPPPSYTSPAPSSKRTKRGGGDVSMEGREQEGVQHESPFQRMKRPMMGE
jgi:hypothetical protein